VRSLAAVDEKVIGLSLTSDFKDFEDGNKQDYKADRIPVKTPEKFLAVTRI
jgi:hypothetical protein